MTYSVITLPHFPLLSTVCLLTHVLCKPTHFCFHSFKATMSYSLQARFNLVIKDWPYKHHIWGTPTRSASRPNSRQFKHAFLHTKKEHVCLCYYIIYAVYLCRILSCLKVFTLFYHIPHRRNPYVAGNLLNITSGKNETCL